MRQFWIVGESGSPEGPFIEQELIQGLVQGRWNSTTLTCEVGKEEWIPLAGLQNVDFSGAQAATKLLKGGAASMRSAAVRVSKLDKDEIDAWLLLPAKLSEQAIRLLKKLLTESVFEWIAIAFGWMGLVAVPISMLALALYLVVAALRTDRLSMLGWVIPAFLAACFLQFVSARFSREADVAVRQTPTDYSRGSVFDMLGLLLVALGLWLTFRGFASAIDQPRAANAHLLLSVFGLLNIAMGGFFLHPESLGMRKQQNSTIGQDGVAVAVITWYGALAYTLNSESLTGVAWMFGGVALVVYGSVLPLLTYILSMVIFVLVEVVDYFVGEDSVATRTDAEATGNKAVNVVSEKAEELEPT
jgi:hypothetical protein